MILVGRSRAAPCAPLPTIVLALYVPLCIVFESKPNNDALQDAHGDHQEDREQTAAILQGQQAAAELRQLAVPSRVATEEPREDEGDEES